MPIPPSSRLAKILNARNLNRTKPKQPQPPQDAPTAGKPAPKIAEIPSRVRELEPAEASPVDDPVFNTSHAAQILGLSTDRLMKWRQRGQGPAYLQYKQNGSVRYELSALIEFKAAHRVRPSRQPHPGRRRS